MFCYQFTHSMQITAMWKICVFTWVATYGQHVPDGEEKIERTSSQYFVPTYRDQVDSFVSASAVLFLVYVVYIDWSLAPPAE